MEEAHPVTSPCSQAGVVAAVVRSPTRQCSASEAGAVVPGSGVGHGVVGHALRHAPSKLRDVLAFCAALCLAFGVLAVSSLRWSETCGAAARYPDVAGEPVPFGSAGNFGSLAGMHLAAPVVGMAATPTGRGYWLVAADGGVFAFGTAEFYGSMATQTLEDPVVAMAATVQGSGYWLLPTTPPPTLGPGSTGSAVLGLQQRLSALGYWLGTPDGTFGDSTEQAVYALQKAAGITADGIVGPSTYAALERGVVPEPLDTSGYVIEIDLQDDLLMFVTNGKLDYVLNTSTGGGYTYTATGVTSVADTPVGHFEIYSEVDGWVIDSLGALWRPKFFDAGFAIHGDTYVPPFPVSHGCVRVSFTAIDWIWTDGLAPVGTAVWVY